jgi:putative ABC transport system permease protein
MHFQDPPIALLQLRAQKTQTFAAIASIAFIAVLLFMQLGFRAAFLNALLELPQKLQGELFLFNTSTETVLKPVKFSARRLYQVAAFDGVESVTPLYDESTEMQGLAGNLLLLNRMRVIAFPPNQNPFAIPEITPQLSLLKESGVFLMDRRSRSEFAPVLQQIASQGSKAINIRGGEGMTRISVKGLFPLGINDAYYSHLVTSDETFMDVFKRERNDINIGVIHLKSGVDATKVQKAILAYLPSDVVVKQKSEMLANESDLFEFKTPLGMVIRGGMGTAILVGIVVLYQILFQLTSKYLRDYATLKALGFSHGMLLGIVLTQAITLAVAGYLLGLGMAFFFYNHMSNTTGMNFMMTFTNAAAVFALICFICLVSALLAIRQLSKADPADLFG